MRLSAIILTLSLTLSAHAIVMRHDRDIARYIELGARYPSVGSVGGQTACTLIAPRWALGAAHTVEDYFNPRGEPYILFGGQRYVVEKMILHPGRVRGSVDAASDLALFKLARPVEGIAPVPLYERDDEPGRIAVIVGYGGVGNGIDGPGEKSKVPLGARNRIEGAFENTLVMLFDAPPLGDDLEGFAGPGDSGCPAFFEVDGKLYLAGVGSFNTGDAEAKTASRYHTLDAFARVSTRRQWIVDTMAADPPSTVPMFGKYVASTDLPKTQAAKIAKTLVDAFNSGKTAEIANFYRLYGKKRTEEEIQKVAGSWQALIDEYGRYELQGFSEAGPHAITLFVRATKPDIGRAVAVILDPKPPHTIVRMLMADVPEPE